MGCVFALRSPLRTRQEIHRLLPMVRCTRIKRLRQSGFVANGTRRLTFFASPSTADNGTAVRAFAAPTPTCAPTACVLPSARSVLRTSIADNRTSIGFIGLTFLVHRLMARNWRCLDERETVLFIAMCGRRGTRSIASMTASAALISSFVQAVLTWRHRTVTSTSRSKTLLRRHRH